MHVAHIALCEPQTISRFYSRVFSKHTYRTYSNGTSRDCATEIASSACVTTDNKKKTHTQILRQVFVALFSQKQRYTRHVNVSVAAKIFRV